MQIADKRTDTAHCFTDGDFRDAINILLFSPRSIHCATGFCETNFFVRPIPNLGVERGFLQPVEQRVRPRESQFHTVMSAIPYVAVT